MSQKEASSSGNSDRSVNWSFSDGGEKGNALNRIPYPFISSGIQATRAFFRLVSMMFVIHKSPNSNPYNLALMTLVGKIAYNSIERCNMENGET